MHVGGFVRGKGKLMITAHLPTDEKTGPRFPLLLTTGRVLTQYNVGAQTRRTANATWHGEDVLEIHPHDAENRGIREGDRVALISRTGDTSLRAHISERVQPAATMSEFGSRRLPAPGLNRQQESYGFRRTVEGDSVVREAWGKAVALLRYHSIDFGIQILRLGVSRQIGAAR